MRAMLRAQRMSTRPSAAALFASLFAVSSGVVAAEPEARPELEAHRSSAVPSSAPSETSEGSDARALAKLEEPGGTYARLFATLAVGKGLRLNNPYRLSTQLGGEATSPSLTATYLDAGAAATFGDPDGLQHGASLHVGGAIEGIVQPYLTPSYVMAYRASMPALLYARAGVPILLAPDVNAGGELAASGSYFFTSGLGVTGELVFDVFYGAATLESRASVIPVFSLQLGVIADVELLP